MPYKLLIDGEFKKEFFKSLKNAKSHVELQFMTFDGDSVGLKVSQILKKLVKRGVRARVLIDYFADIWVSDKPTWKMEVRKEAKRTKKMFEDLEKNGVKIKRTNKLGVLMMKILRRNHKKIVIIDGAAFIGGFNISEHNFEWHDFMVKITGREVGWLLNDFNNTWDGKRYKSNNTILTGRRLFKIYKQCLFNAKREVLITSPYILDKPSVDLFLRVAKKGVKVKVLTLKKNNFLNFRLTKTYLINKMLRHGIEVYYYKRFSHGKCLLVDGTAAIFGSSNFGYQGRMTQEDVCMLSNNAALIKSFETRLFNKDLASSVKAGYESSNHIGSFMASLLVIAFIRLYSTIIK